MGDDGSARHDLGHRVGLLVRIVPSATDFLGIRGSGAEYARRARR